MAQNYPGLIIKKHHYYFRMAVPRCLWTLAKCKEICYSLGTSDFAFAIKIWKEEIGYFQRFINIFESICMKICKGDVILDSNDVDKVLLYRLEQIQFFTEENEEEINNGTKTAKDIRLYDVFYVQNQ